MGEDVEVQLVDSLCHDIRNDPLDGLCSQLVLDEVVVLETVDDEVVAVLLALLYVDDGVALPELLDVDDLLVLLALLYVDDGVALPELLDVDDPLVLLALLYVDDAVALNELLDVDDLLVLLELLYLDVLDLMLNDHVENALFESLGALGELAV